jgi:hypothetical protein
LTSIFIAKHLNQQLASPPGSRMSRSTKLPTQSEQGRPHSGGPHCQPLHP